MKDPLDKTKRQAFGGPLDDIPDDTCYIFPGFEALVPVAAGVAVDGGKAIWKRMGKTALLVVQILESKEAENDAYLVEMQVVNLGVHSIYIEDMSVDVDCEMTISDSSQGKIGWGTTDDSEAGGFSALILQPADSKVFSLSLNLADKNGLKERYKSKEKYPYLKITIRYHELSKDQAAETSEKVALRLN